MITLTEQPPGIPDLLSPTEPPVPLSDCIRYCLQPDAGDAIATSGGFATLVVVIPFTCSVPADGTPFKIWGYDFTIDSATDFTSSSFAVNALGLLTLLNFANMINANVFFNRSVTGSLQIVGSTYELTYTWNECREQPRFTVDDMELDVFTSIGGSAVATNGTSPVYVDGFRIITRGYSIQDATNSGFPLGPFVGLESEKQCTEVGETCVVMNEDFGAELYTPLPDLTPTSKIDAITLGRSMMKLFCLEYGWTYRENCVSKSGTITKSNQVLVLNAAFDIDDPYQIRRYWYGHPDGFPNGLTYAEFLTYQPKSRAVRTDSFLWLTMLNNWQDDFGQYNLKASFAIYALDGTISSVETYIVNNSLTEGHSWHQPVNFNVSPSFLVAQFGTNLSNVLKYSVQVSGVNSLDDNDVFFNATEYLEFVLLPSCESKTDLYFLNSPGGIDTFDVQIDKIEVVQDGNEIQLAIPCGTSRTDRGKYGGRTLVNLRSYSKYTLSAELQRTDENRRWITDLRKSPQRWLKITDDAGSPLAKKFILSTGSIRVTEVAVGIKIELEGYLQDIPTQPVTEKRLQ